MARFAVTAVDDSNSFILEYTPNTFPLQGEEHTREELMAHLQQWLDHAQFIEVEGGTLLAVRHIVTIRRIEEGHP